MRELFQKIDPRYFIFSILLTYLILGFTILGFNRTPLQALATSLSAMFLEMLLTYFLKGKKLHFPFSALITSLSLTLLLNYSHNYYLLLVPVFFAIGSKYILVFNNKHVFNPAQAGVTLTLLFCGHLITSAPAYQWYGMESIGILILLLGLFFVLPKVNRIALVLSFLFFYSLQTCLRALIIRHHLPFETLFLGSITSPAFLLFTFFMITDPQTSPNGRKQQIKVGFLLAFLDLFFHLRQSYYTFFYAGFTLQSYRLISFHFAAIREYKSSVFYYVKEKFWHSGYYKRVITILVLAFFGLGIYHNIISPSLPMNKLDFTFKEMTSTETQIEAHYDGALYRVDKRLHHIVKWILSVGDSAAAGDFDGDGLVDLFFTFPFKTDQERNSLYRNLGHFQFERVPLPTIAERSKNIEEFGLPSNALFVDYDNDQDIDLFIVYAFGHPVMLKNNLREKGKATFTDVTKDLGLDIYTNALAANFFDFNRDGKLDLLIGNVWPTHLPNYPLDNPQLLNVFHLPQPAYEGDIRMFNFMHKSWHLADNGGTNDFFIQNENGTFKKMDSALIGMPEHFWTLAIGTADFNRDGFIDLYVANDFGPDNFYLNKSGNKFEKIEGTFFGDLGRDTYKGMNASVEDLNHDGFQDVYVSNVHHEMQAEGSLLWTFNKDEKGNLTYKEMATKWGALNENRFGWGASIADFNNDGLLDLIQANGMVDDMTDKKFDHCKDYWYTNEKIARSPPEIHRYIHYWGDIRGYCIYPNELNRLYLNTGKKDSQVFVDVAERVGLTQKNNSRGVLAADFNNDGLMDSVITNQFTAPTILKGIKKENYKESDHQWLGIHLISMNKACNTMALGSTMELTYFSRRGEKKILYRETKLANGFSAQNEQRIHFGLGAVDENKPLHLKINWCQLKTEEYKIKKWNNYYTKFYN